MGLEVDRYSAWSGEEWRGWRVLGQAKLSKPYWVLISTSSSLDLDWEVGVSRLAGGRSWAQPPGDSAGLGCWIGAGWEVEGCWARLS